MIKEIIKEIILDFQQETYDVGVRRHLQYKLVPGKAFICMGVRRCGKSTLLFQIMEELKEKGVERENILYLNFFDDRLSELRRGDPSVIMEAYFSLYPQKKGIQKIYCFFDEIQEMNNWEPFVDRVMRSEKCEVYLSGSSANMLSKEIATQMRGRSLSWELFPFSFKEYLDYKKIDYSKLTSRNRLLIMKSFDEYWKKGGFPEVKDAPGKMRIMIHQEYYKAILHRDIIERFDISHPQAVIYAGHKLISSIASLYSINRITEYLRSCHYGVTKEFVKECTQWFEDAYFLFSIRLFNPSVSKQNVNPKKCYCIDHSLALSVNPDISVDAGHILENIVFIYLRQRNENIYYYRTKNGNEVDFVWKEGRNRNNLLQVCYSMKREEAKKREFRSLLEAMRELKEREATIITYEEEDLIKTDHLRINVIPAWKYLIR